MAIAPFEDTEGTAGRTARHALRVIPGGRPAGAAPRRAALHAAPVTRDGPRQSRDTHPSAQRVAARPRAGRQLRAGDPTAARDPQSRPLTRPVAISTAARRRRAGGVVIALAAVVLLALPLRALGAVTLAGQATPDGVPSGLAPGTTIVVQPGDTIHSVAMRVNPHDVAQIARALVAEVGSTTLVPGEHVVIP
jgi:hypothetical protein